MKIILTVFNLCLIVFSLSAKLTPLQPAKAYRHFIEVNERWLYEVSPAEHAEEITFQTEDDRIKAHLLAVYSHLSVREMPQLSSSVRAKRMVVLDLLKLYAERAIFPTNDRLSQRTPFFVDDQQVHCAVGYLLRHSGAGALEDRITSETNNGYVLKDLDKYEEIANWAEAHGFSSDELAWIQPGYLGSFMLNPSVFGNNLGITGGEARCGLDTDDHIFIGGDFKAFDGLNCEGFVRITDGEVIALESPYTSIEQLFLMPDNTIFILGEAASGTDSMLLSSYDYTTEEYLQQWNLAPDAGLFIMADSLEHPILFIGKMNSLADTVELYELISSTQQLRRMYEDYVFTGIINGAFYIPDGLIVAGDFNAFDSNQQLLDSNQIWLNLLDEIVRPDNSELYDNADASYISNNFRVLNFLYFDSYDWTAGTEYYADGFGLTDHEDVVFLICLIHLILLYLTHLSMLNHIFTFLEIIEI